ncbi:MAG: hypothetical protein KDA89_00500, partial [Planctomycetaceae bacterium]|nr:hypothetical protein [Planctomycetaceae bacterium]
MQGSFWKTVSVVGVIGIGSLVILEVQNRLRQSPHPGNQVPAATAADDRSAEEIMDAMLSSSQFEQRLASADSASAKFVGTQDKSPAASNDDGVMFFNTEPPANNTHSGTVDSHVHADRLVDGENPFGGRDTTAASGSPATSSNNVVTASFLPDHPSTATTHDTQAKNEFAAFVRGPTEDQPSAGKSAQVAHTAATDSSPFAPFDGPQNHSAAPSNPATHANSSQTAARPPAQSTARDTSSAPVFDAFPTDAAPFTGDSATDASPQTAVDGPTGNSGTAQTHSASVADNHSQSASQSSSSAPVTAARNGSQQLMFFGEGGSAPTNPRASASAPAGQSGARFFGADSAPPNANVETDPFSADPTPEPLNTDPFPGLPAPTTTPPQLRPTPEPDNLNSAPGSGFFTEDDVPAPRLPSRSPSDDLNAVPFSGAGSPLPDMPGESRPRPSSSAPSTGPGSSTPPSSPRNDSTLPFAEDIESTIDSGPVRVPELREERLAPRSDSGLTIPGMSGADAPHFNTVPSRTEPQFDHPDLPSRNTPADRRTPSSTTDFPPLEETLPPDTRTAPFNVPRTFDSGSQPAHPSDIVPEIRSRDTGVREFSPDSSNLGTSPRDSGNTPRDFGSNNSNIQPPRSPIRQVSGVMRPNL